MASDHPKILIYFKKNGKLENVEITWDSQEKMTHVSDIRAIIYENLRHFGLSRNTKPSDIILKDFYGKQELFDFEKIDRDLILLLQIRTSPMNDTVFSNVKSFLGKNDQFNSRLAQRKKIPELEKGVNCIEMCDRIRKYLPTYKKVWKRIGWEPFHKFDEDYFNSVTEWNEASEENGDGFAVELPHLYDEDDNDVTDFWEALYRRLINFGMIIMSENISESRLEEENSYWEKLMKDNDEYWEMSSDPNNDEGIDDWNDNPYPW